MAVADLPSRPRLPEHPLPGAGGGAPVPLRAHRRGTVLALLGPAPSADDLAYLRALAAAEPALAAWDGRVVVVVPDDAAAHAVAALALPFPTAVDAAGRVADAAGAAAPALVVADQWGEVHEAAAATDAGGARAWPDPADVEEWLRFLAVRCAG